MIYLLRQQPWPSWLSILDFFFLYTLSNIFVGSLSILPIGMFCSMNRLHSSLQIWIPVCHYEFAAFYNDCTHLSSDFWTVMPNIYYMRTVSTPCSVSPVVKPPTIIPDIQRTTTTELLSDAGVTFARILIIALINRGYFPMGPPLENAHFITF